MEKEEKWLKTYDMVGTFEEVEDYLEEYTEEEEGSIIIDPLTSGMGDKLYGVAIDRI